MFSSVFSSVSFFFFPPRLFWLIDLDRVVVKGEEIGEGAYAMVYRGTWKGRPVAVKEIKFEAAGTAEMEAFW